MHLRPLRPPQERALENPTDLGLSAALAPVAEREWWTAYQDPQLDRLLSGALADNPTLAQSLARVRKAQAEAAAVHADSWPSISYDASETRERFSAHDPIPRPYGGTPRWNGSEGFNLSWDLDFWGRQAALVRQANALSDAAALDSAGARLAIAGAVVRSYLELDRAYALADVAQRTEQQRLQILAITQRRLKAGLDTTVELRQAEGAVADVRVDLTQIQAERERAVHLLAALSGQGATAHAKIERPRLRADAALVLPGSLPFDLLARRPDVLAAHARIVSARGGLAAAKAAFYPDIDLLAFAGTSAIGFDNLFQRQCPHLWCWDRRSMCRSSMPASSERCTAAALRTWTLPSQPTTKRSWRPYSRPQTRSATSSIWIPVFSNNSSRWTQPRKRSASPLNATGQA